MPISCTACAAAVAVCSAVGSAIPMSSLAWTTSRRAMKRGSSPAVEHPRQVVQGGVDVGTADRLDERADHVVVLIAVAVVADGRLVDTRLDGREVQQPTVRVTGLVERRARRRLERGERPAGVAGREPHQMVHRVVRDLDLPAETPLVGDAPARAGSRCRPR